MTRLTSLLMMVVPLIHNSIASAYSHSGRPFSPSFLATSTNQEQKIRETRSKGFEDFFRRNNQQAKTHLPNVAVAQKCWCTKFSVCIYQSSHNIRENFSENFARCLKNRARLRETERRQEHVHVTRSSPSAPLKRSLLKRPMQIMPSSERGTTVKKLFIKYYFGYQHVTSNNPWDASESNKSRFAWHRTEINSNVKEGVSWPIWIVFPLLTMGCFAIIMLSCYILYKKKDSPAHDDKVEFKEPNMKSRDVTQASSEGDLNTK